MLTFSRKGGRIKSSAAFITVAACFMSAAVSCEGAGNGDANSAVPAGLVMEIPFKGPGKLALVVQELQHLRPASSWLAVNDGSGWQYEEIPNLHSATWLSGNRILLYLSGTNKLQVLSYEKHKSNVTDLSDRYSFVWVQPSTDKKWLAGVTSDSRGATELRIFRIADHLQQRAVYEPKIGIEGQPVWGPSNETVAVPVSYDDGSGRLRACPTLVSRDGKMIGTLPTLEHCRAERTIPLFWTDSGLYVTDGSQVSRCLVRETKCLEVRVVPKSLAILDGTLTGITSAVLLEHDLNSDLWSPGANIVSQIDLRDGKQLWQWELPKPYFITSVDWINSAQ